MAVAVVSGACSTGGGPDGGPAASADTTEVPTTPPPTLPSPAPYAPLPDEPAADAKQLAGRVLQAIGTYDVGGGTPEAARGRLTGLAVDPAVVDAAMPLLDPAVAATMEVVYPQMGGLTANAASVMVVARRAVLRDGEESSTTRTIDVRLSLTADGWSVTELASLGGEPVPAPPPSALAQQVIEHPNIDLPDSALWDIRAGRISDEILTLLIDLASTHTLSVAVLASGHPSNVFASTSVSNHTKGRAVDIWAIDGTPVLQQRGDGSPLMHLVRQQLGAGVTELGSPWDLDGPGGPSFSDIVHQDHLHLAYDEL